MTVGNPVNIIVTWHQHPWLRDQASLATSSEQVARRCQESSTKLPIFCPWVKSNSSQHELMVVVMAGLGRPHWTLRHSHWSSDCLCGCNHVNDTTINTNYAFHILVASLQDSPHPQSYPREVLNPHQSLRLLQTRLLSWHAWWSYPEIPNNNQSMYYNLPSCSKIMPKQKWINKSLVRITKLCKPWNLTYHNNFILVRSKVCTLDGKLSIEWKHKIINSVPNTCYCSQKLVFKMGHVTSQQLLDY